MVNSKKIRIAVIGIGLRGIGLLKYVLHMPDVEVLEVCDRVRKKLDVAKEAFVEKNRDASNTLFTEDYKEALEIKEIDAVRPAAPTT